jgi:chromosome segregation ATPase
MRSSPREQLGDARGDATELQRRLAELESTIAQHNEALRELQAHDHHAQDRVTALEEEKALIQGRLDEATGEKASLLSRLEGAEATVGELQAALEGLTAENADLRRQMDTLRATLHGDVKGLQLQVGSLRREMLVVPLGRPTHRRLFCPGSGCARRSWRWTARRRRWRSG